MAMMGRSLARAEQASLPIARAPPGLQPKLRIGPVDDPLEREADRIADAVISDQPIGAIGGAPTNTPQRKCAACEAEEENALRRKSASGNPGAPVQAALTGKAAAAVSSGGVPLSKSERAYF